MQPMQPGQLLDQLTNTLDYTFIDLPELVDGEVSVASVST